MTTENLPGISASDIIDYRWLTDTFNSFVIVAKRGGRGDDWAAYLGAAPAGSLSEGALIRRAVEHGAKLPQAWALVIFPKMQVEGLEYRP